MVLKQEDRGFKGLFTLNVWVCVWIIQKNANANALCKQALRHIWAKYLYVYPTGAPGKKILPLALQPKGLCSIQSSIIPMHMPQGHSWVYIEYQVRIQDLCKGEAQPRFCRHCAAESWRRQKFGPQNWGGGGAGGPPPPRSAPVILSKFYILISCTRSDDLISRALCSSFKLWHLDDNNHHPCTLRCAKNNHLNA